MKLNFLRNILGIKFGDDDEEDEFMYAKVFLKCGHTFSHRFKPDDKEDAEFFLENTKRISLEHVACAELFK